jgi:micrococcal nuclease
MYHYKAIVLRVIDADTLKISVDLGFHTWRVENVRIQDYDAPEIRLYEGVTQEEKDLGLEAKAYAESLFAPGANIEVRTFYNKTGKYGRFLAQIFIQDPDNPGLLVDYATHMKEKGFVK